MHWNRIFCRANIRMGLFPLVCSQAPWAANIPITIVGSTETQIAVRYTPTSSGPCTITVTDNNNGPVAADFDASKFANAATDLGRTVANGFRWPTLTNGSTRTVFIGGHDEIKQGLDGKWYSTALQVASDHTITVACNSGADAGTIHANTSNLPTGSSYPELPIPATSNPNPGFPVPTINWSDRTTKYIDPTTGVLLQRVFAPLDLPGGTNSGLVFNFAYDVNGSWTNPNNALTNQQSGTLASTTTANAPLFLASNSSWLSQQVTDEQVVIYGKGNAGTEIATICWSEDSGQTCASGSLDSTAFGTGAGVQSSLPSSYPSNQFSSWGNWTKGTGTFDLGNVSFTGINATGSVVTMPSWTGSGFNTDRVAGSKFTLTSCGVGTDITLTVSHMDSPTQVTVAETGLSRTNCTYQDYGSGIRIVLKNSGTLNVSATYNNALVASAASNTSGARDVCNINKVTDIAKDCDGVTQSPNFSGKLCQVQIQGSMQAIYLLQDNGRMCLQSIGKHSGVAQHLYAMSNPWLTSKSWMGSDGVNVWSVTKGASDHDYTEYVPGVNPVDDVWTYANVSGTGTPLATQIASAGGNAASDLANGLWGTSYSINAIIGGYIQTAYPGGGDGAPCFRAMLDGTWRLTQTYDSWRHYPMRWGGCHSGPGGVGKYQPLTVNPIARFSSGALLGGPFILPITSIRRNGTFQTYSFAVGSGTAGNPTTMVSSNHDLASRKGMGQSGGPYVTCSGGTGSWASVNGTFHATVTDNNTITIPVNTSGVLSGSITCQTAPPLPVVAVGNIMNASPPVVTINPDPNYNAFVPDNRSLFQDGDPIVFSALSQTKQYYAKATGQASNAFAVYADAGLTTPASYASIASAANNGMVAWAEACPSTNAATLMPNGTLYFDSGTLIAGVPKIRCVTLRIRSQPCSEWPTTGEKTSYPCATNANFSSLQNIAPGDVLYSLESSDVQDHEHKLVLAVAINSPTSIDLTLMRWYGDDPSWGVGGYTGNSACCVNSPGWTPYAYYTMKTTWFDSSDATGIPYPQSPSEGSHGDLGEGGPGAGLVNLAVPPTGYDDIVNVTMQQMLATPVVSTHNNFAVWAGDKNDTLANGPWQSYASHRQATAALSEQLWKGDVTAVNVESGSSGGAIDGAGINRTVTKITGFNYVYRITNPAPSGVTNIKLVPYLMTGGIQYFQDIGGPSNCHSNPNAANCITDSTIGKYCIAFAANECNDGSTVGQVYFTSKIMYDPGSCYSNNQTVFNPCLYPLWPSAGWLQQFRQSPVDYTGSGTRRLTMGWSMPLEHFVYYNWISDPEAKWGFFVSNPLNGKVVRGNGYGTLGFAMKLPPWPSFSDKIDRTTFIPVPIRFPPNPGASIRIAFGYAENGDPANLYCTTRQETCWTSAAPTASNPFVFAGESQQKVACDSGCTVSIPAIPGRVLFYQVEHTSGSGTVSDPLQAVALR